MLVIGTAALVLLNMGLGFARGMWVSGNVSAALGTASVQLVIPIVVALLFSVSRKFRNARSSTKIVLWASAVVLIAAIGNPH
jgi:hypothetical protein